MSIKTDNNILRTIKSYNNDNEDIYEETLIPEVRSDVFLNWTKTSSRNILKETEDLKKKAESYVNLGLSDEQIKDILIGEGNDIKAVKAVVSNIKKDGKVLKIAKTYNDIKNNVEKALLETDPKTFIKNITANDDFSNSIVIFSSNKDRLETEELIKYAFNRKNDTNLFDELHSKLSNHFEREINRSYLLAEINQDNTKIAETNKKEVISMVCSDQKPEVNILNKTCSCDRFKLGNYEIFGIPCEHIVIADRKTSEDEIINNIKRNIEEEYGSF
jgi:hypothetical protein